MARDMTPAAIRRLGGLLPGPDGEWIPLGQLGVDARVVEIACITLIERTMGKPKEYDPSTDSEAKSHLDVSKWTPEERELARRLFDKARTVEPSE